MREKVVILVLCLMLPALVPAVSSADLCRGLFAKTEGVDFNKSQWNKIQENYARSLDKESLRDLEWFSSIKNKSLALKLNEKLHQHSLGSIGSRELLVSQTLTSLLRVNPFLLNPGSLLFFSSENFQMKGDFFTLKKGQRFSSQQFVLAHLDPQIARQELNRHEGAPVLFIMETEGEVPALPSLDDNWPGFILSDDMEFEVVSKSHAALGTTPFPMGLPTLYVHLRARQP